MPVTKMPTETRRITMEPDLSARVEAMLEPYSGEELEAAQKAVQAVYASGYSGSFDAVVSRYREAIEEAVS